MSQPPTKFTFDTEFFDVATNSKGGSAGSNPSGIPGKLPSTAANAAASNSRQTIFDEGFASGLQEGRKQAQADLAQLQQHLQNTLLSLQNMLNERESQILSQMLTLLHTTMHRMVGTIVEKWAPDLLEHHLKAIISNIKTDETLTLRLHPGARGYHEKLQLPHASILGLPMHISPDTTLGHTDVVVEWKNGGAESKLTQHLAQLTQLLTAAGANPLPQPPLPEPQPLPNQAPEPQLSTPNQPPTPPNPNPKPPKVAQPLSPQAAELLGDDELHEALKS